MKQLQLSDDGFDDLRGGRWTLGPIDTPFIHVSVRCWIQAVQSSRRKEKVLERVMGECINVYIDGNSPQIDPILIVSCLIDKIQLRQN